MEKKYSYTAKTNVTIQKTIGKTNHYSIRFRKYPEVKRKLDNFLKNFPKLAMRQKIKSVIPFISHNTFFHFLQHTRYSRSFYIHYLI